MNFLSPNHNQGQKTINSPTRERFPYSPVRLLRMHRCHTNPQTKHGEDQQSLTHNNVRGCTEILLQNLQVVVGSDTSKRNSQRYQRQKIYCCRSICNVCISLQYMRTFRVLTFSSRTCTISVQFLSSTSAPFKGLTRTATFNRIYGIFAQT